VRLIDALRGFFSFFLDLWQNRSVIAQLTKRDFQNKYLGSYLGLPWAFVKPLAVILVMWFAFTYGLKVGRVDDSVPFAMWLMVGIIPWFYVSENVTGSIRSLQEYAFLIKNISFRTSIIPLIKILTNSMIHLFFILVIVGICLAYGYSFSIYWFQVFYYMACSIVLTLGMSWFFSALQLFVRDISHLLEVAVQLFFWGTPIIWSYKMLPEKYAVFLKLNPVFYLVEGYRNTFIYEVWFFEDWKTMVYFWCVMTGVLFTGALVFKKLKPHFADVL
jgi:lipopolysaccharide transport system permease protein/teichoic acid transport system permease protein